MAKVKENESLMGAASYLGFFITGILFILLEKESKFVRFHAMQSTMLFGGLFVVICFLTFFPIIGWLINTLLVLGGFILWIVCMWKAFQGEMFKLPRIGDLAEKQLAKMK